MSRHRRWQLAYDVAMCGMHPRLEPVAAGALVYLDEPFPPATRIFSPSFFRWRETSSFSIWHPPSLIQLLRHIIGQAKPPVAFFFSCSCCRCCFISISFFLSFLDFLLFNHSFFSCSLLVFFYFLLYQKLIHYRLDFEFSLSLSFPLLLSFCLIFSLLKVFQVLDRSDVTNQWPADVSFGLLSW